MKPLVPPDLGAIRAAQERLRGVAVRTPLVHLDVSDLDVRFKAHDRARGVFRNPPRVDDDAMDVHLKLETLQPIGSFKLRGAGNALRCKSADALRAGVWTPSAGNMAQGVAWSARQLDVACTAVVPEAAPQTKLAALDRLGARVLKVPFEAWWDCLLTHRSEDVQGVLVHPVNDADVVAGNGTIGLEIFDDLPDVDTVLVPYGGGGLSVGIAAALRASRPDVRIYACEVETAAPFAASLEADAPACVEHRASFVDGIGGRSVLPEMWPAARDLLDGAIVVTLDEVCDAIRLLVERLRVVAEGAGAAPVAAALSGRAGGGRIVCVVSGGNLDPATLATILRGERPLAPRT